MRVGSEPDSSWFCFTGSDPEFGFQLAHSLTLPPLHTSPMPLDLLIAVSPFLALFVLWVLDD